MNVTVTRVGGCADPTTMLGRTVTAAATATSFARPAASSVPGRSQRVPSNPQPMLVPPGTSRPQDPATVEAHRLYVELAGQVFVSPEKAALAMSHLINPISVETNREICFGIFEREEGGFRVGEPLLGAEGTYGVNPSRLLSDRRGERVVAISHTHGSSAEDRAGTSMILNTERLSGTDRTFAEEHELPIYFASPKGVFGVYDPATNRSRYWPAGTVTVERSASADTTDIQNCGALESRR